MHRYRFLVINTILLLTVAASQWGRSLENATVTRKDFLQGLETPFRDWKPRALSLTSRETELLEPDATLMLHYEGRDAFAELAVVAGHRKKTLHTPGFCMVGGGWEVTSQKSRTIRIGSQQVPAVQSVLMKGNERLLATYFFSDGEYTTDSLPKFLAVQTFKRIRARTPVGALVRIIVPITETVAKASGLTEEFSGAAVPPVLQRLRSVRLQTG